MSKKNWGETFLKTGLPLEHLALSTLVEAAWVCMPKYEYERENREGKLAWFEVDLVAKTPDSSRGNLNLLIECKYHDEQRFWFFLPCNTEDHLAQYNALSAGGDLEADPNVLHYAPYVPLQRMKGHSLISLAPKSVWGVNVSRVGTREENSIQEALDQLGFAFVPFCLEWLYSFCQYTPEAVVLAIVTTAKLFRLRSDIGTIAAIRNASGPEDIAEQMPWTWCYYAPREQLLRHNHDEIEIWRRRHTRVHFAGLEDQLAELWSGPHWVMVVSIDHLRSASDAVRNTFWHLPKDFGPNRRLKRAVEGFASSRRARPQTKTG